MEPNKPTNEASGAAGSLNCVPVAESSHGLSAAYSARVLDFGTVGIEEKRGSVESEVVSDPRDTNDQLQGAQEENSFALDAVSDHWAAENQRLQETGCVIVPMKCDVEGSRPDGASDAASDSASQSILERDRESEGEGKGNLEEAKQ